MWNCLPLCRFSSSMTLGMRKLPLTAAEELLEIIMRRYERASTLITSNRPVEDWGKLLGDSAAHLRHAGSSSAPRPRSQMRPAQLANQDRQSGRKPMTNQPQLQQLKTTAIRMPAKNARRHRDPGSKGLPRRSPTIGILVETKTSNCLPIGHAAEALITDSFGVNFVSSALDHSAKRDPGGASINLSCDLSR